MKCYVGRVRDSPKPCREGPWGHWGLSRGFRSGKQGWGENWNPGSPVCRGGGESCVDGGGRMIWILWVWIHLEGVGTPGAETGLERAGAGHSWWWTGQRWQKGPAPCPMPRDGHGAGGTRRLAGPSGSVLTPKTNPLWVEVAREAQVALVGSAEHLVSWRLGCVYQSAGVGGFAGKVARGWGAFLQPGFEELRGVTTMHMPSQNVLGDGWCSPNGHGGVSAPGPQNGAGFGDGCLKRG